MHPTVPDGTAMGSSAFSTAAEHCRMRRPTGDPTFDDGRFGVLAVDQDLGERLGVGRPAIEVLAWEVSPEVSVQDLLGGAEHVETALRCASQRLLPRHTQGDPQRPDVTKLWAHEEDAV